MSDQPSATTSQDRNEHLYELKRRGVSLRQLAPDARNAGDLWVVRVIDWRRKLRDYLDDLEAGRNDHAAGKLSKEADFYLQETALSPQDEAFARQELLNIQAGLAALVPDAFRRYVPPKVSEIARRRRIIRDLVDNASKNGSSRPSNDEICKRLDRIGIPLPVSENYQGKSWLIARRNDPDHIDKIIAADLARAKRDSTNIRRGRHFIRVDPPLSLS